MIVNVVDQVVSGSAPPRPDLGEQLAAAVAAGGVSMPGALAGDIDAGSGGVFRGATAAAGLAPSPGLVLSPPPPPPLMASGAMDGGGAEAGHLADCAAVEAAAAAAAAAGEAAAAGAGLEVGRAAGALRERAENDRWKAESHADDDDDVLFLPKTEIGRSGKLRSEAKGGSLGKRAFIKKHRKGC